MKGINVGMKSKVDNSFDMLKLTIQLISVSKGFVLSDTQIFALTYFVMHGYNKVTREELLQNKLLKTKNALSNLISEFRKFGIIKKTTLSEEIISDFNIPSEGIDAIKFDIIISK